MTHRFKKAAAAMRFRAAASRAPSKSDGFAPIEHKANIVKNDLRAVVGQLTHYPARLLIAFDAKNPS